MSNFGAIEQLNVNLEKLIKILEVYPSPVDEAVKAAPPQEAKSESPAPEKPETETVEVEKVESTITNDDLIKMVKEAVQKDKVTNTKALKEYLNGAGAAKATDLEGEAREAFAEFIRGL